VHLVDELTQPLLDLVASPSCPPHLQAPRGRKVVVSTDKRLLGKHFAYKLKRGEGAQFAVKKKTPSGKQ